MPQGDFSHRAFQKVLSWHQTHPKSLGSPDVWRPTQYSILGEQPYSCHSQPQFPKENQKKGPKHPNCCNP